ncbi:MAG: hypothetical protein PHS45_04665 [Bacilli bacterium]|nr:hypothetical protein [Bacilli bacterium]
MSNFLEFINEDIEAKKTLISTMPTKTKTNIKKFNEKVVSISEKYDEYKVRVKKYLDTKSRSFNIKGNDKNLERLRNNVSTLERVRFILNPTNTPLEKIGFDNLLYEISNYYDFNFNSLNDIINQFLNKFELAEIKLVSNDFDYTYYVHEYMVSFFEVRNKKSENYDKVSEIFEKIYWVNPEIIEHIELNFRKLIKKYEKKFTNYISKLQKEVMLKNKINSYEECLGKLKVAYTELNKAERENICDIINLAKTGEIDINNYFEDSKIRTSTYSALMIDSLNLNDSEIMDKFYDNLEKLKTNINEYNNYIKFTPLFNDFKSQYEEHLSSSDKISNKKLKIIDSKIANLENKLEKINKKVFRGEPGLFDLKNNDDLRQLKLDSIRHANELYDLYKAYDQEYIDNKVLAILNSSLTISELLHLYYSFDYFKKVAIKRVFDLTTYDEVIEYSDSFDLFAMNPTNIVTNGALLFEENDIAKVIMNRYRLDNINVTEESLDPDELDNLLDKIQLLLRISEIEESSTTVEKIWFMVQVEKINAKENKNN